MRKRSADIMTMTKTETVVTFLVEKKTIMMAKMTDKIREE
jgi:hypothetical protein